MKRDALQVSIVKVIQIHLRHGENGFIVNQRAQSTKKKKLNTLLFSAYKCDNSSETRISITF